MAMNSKQQFVLNKNSQSSKFHSFTGDANFFLDKMLRIVYLTVLWFIDLVLLLYLVNANFIENGEFNPSVMVIVSGVFILSFLGIFLLSFSKNLQNLLCAVMTFIFVVVFLKQFAVFDLDNFLETWFNQYASWLSFLCVFPSYLMVATAFSVLIFFGFRSRLFMCFVVFTLLLMSLIGVRVRESVPITDEEYTEIKSLQSNVGVNRIGRSVYIMVPKLPSYQYLGSFSNSAMRDFRNMLVGFYAANGFEIYPNAFVQRVDTKDNVIDILNQVDYNSNASQYRGYSEFINNWEFAHDSLLSINLEDNKLYRFFKDSGLGVSTYSMPGVNLCVMGQDIYSDRCVIKAFKPKPFVDKTKSLQENTYSLIIEWILSLKSRELSGLAKMFVSQSGIKGYKITSENRRVSAEGATDVLNFAARDFVKDKGGQAYMIYVDLPSDYYIYDEYCNLKPRSQWVSLQDNSLVSSSIEEKRKAYAEQGKCLVGMLQVYLDKISQTSAFFDTNVIIQGVSPIPELAEATSGRYANFVKNNLVSLAIRKSKDAKFLINANICLASDFTKTLLRYQDFCYSLEGLKLSEENTYDLRQNLIHNSVLRGNSVSNMALNYRDWYEDFKKNNIEYRRLKERERLALEKQKQQEMIKPEVHRVSSNKKKSNADSSLILEFDDKGNLISPDEEEQKLLEEETSESEVKEATEEVKEETPKPEVKEVTEEVKEENPEPEVKEVAEEVKEEASEPEVKEVTEEVKEEASEPEVKEVTEEVKEETSAPKSEDGLEDSGDDILDF